MKLWQKFIHPPYPPVPRQRSRKFAAELRRAGPVPINSVSTCSGKLLTANVLLSLDGFSPSGSFRLPDLLSRYCCNYFILSFPKCVCVCHSTCKERPVLLLMLGSSGSFRSHLQPHVAGRALQPGSCRHMQLTESGGHPGAPPLTATTKWPELLLLAE